MMKQFAFVFVVGLLTATAAYSQTLTLSIGGLSESTPPISGAEKARILSAYRAIYGQINVGTAEAPVIRDMTDAETFRAMTKGLFRGIRDVVASHERGVAAKTAIDAVVPVGIQ